MPVHTPKEQGVMIALVFLAIATLVVAFVGIQQKIRAPFLRSGDRLLSREEAAEAERAALKAKDTDHDELSDYDELFVYQTSPYLDDTDSDSFPDGLEVNSGNDPNCPAGTTCGGSPEEAAGALGAPPPAPTDLLDQFNAAQLREVLRAAGVSDEVLSKVDDATLERLYEESLKGSAATTTPREAP